MLRLKKFTLSNNFARRTYDFFDDKLIRTTKSLTVDTVDEIKYEDIRVISCYRMLSINWLWRFFYLCAGIYVLNFILYFLKIDNPTIIAIEKGLIAVGLVLSFLDFRKKEYWSFLDEDRNYLATVSIGKKEKGILSEAIQLIKQRTELFSESHPDKSYPDTPPKFEIVQYNIPDYLRRTIVMVFEDKIIDVEISLLDELVTEISYHELSGKTKTLRFGNRHWEKHWCVGLYIMATISVILELFFQYDVPYYIFFPVVFLPILLSLLKYIKQEYLMFYNHNDNVIYGLIRNKRDHEKVDQIVDFIQNKVPVDVSEKKYPP